MGRDQRGRVNKGGRRRGADRHNNTQTAPRKPAWHNRDASAPRGARRGGRAARGRENAGKWKQDKGPVNKEEREEKKKEALDKQLDAYWNKSDDIRVDKLDQALDDYWKHAEDENNDEQEAEKEQETQE